MDAEAEMEDLFAGDDQSQQEQATQSLTQEGWFKGIKLLPQDLLSRYILPQDFPQLVLYILCPQSGRREGRT
jgi:hypothetical protein